MYERARALEWRDPRVHTNLAVVRQQLGMAPETAPAMVPGHAAASSASGHVAPTRSAQTMRSETTRDGAPEAANRGLAPLERQAALKNGLHGESTRDGAPDAAAPLQCLEERLGPTSGTLLGTLEAGARPRAQGLYL
jgi:hypothetical protein